MATSSSRRSFLQAVGLGTALGGWQALGSLKRGKADPGL